MDTHVKVIAAFYGVVGALLTAGAFFTNIFLRFAAGLVAASGDPDAEIAIPVLGFAGTLLSIVLVTFAIPFFATAWGLWKFQPWARIAGIILGVMCLFSVPFGTLLGVYAMVILFRKDTEAFFGQR